MFEVWTVIHPTDLTKCENLYDAYCAMTELVEDGFEPHCRGENSQRVLTYDEVRASVHE